MDTVIAIALSLAAASAASGQVPVNGLVGYWKGDRSAADASAIGNDGSFSGSYVSGRPGGHAAFDLATDKVRISDQAQYPSHTLLGWTVGFWFNTNGRQLRDSFFLGQDDGSGFRPKWFIDYGYTVFGPTNTFVWHVNDFNQERIFLQSQFVDPTSIENAWNHLTVVTDNVNSTVAFYLNGLGIGSAGLPSYVLQTSSQLVFGATEPGLGYSGLMNDVTLYDRALSSSEVWQLYEANIPAPSAPLALLGVGVLSTVLRRRQ